MTVRLTKEQKIQILNSRDIYAIMRHVLLREKKIDRNKEHIWVVCLATNNRILLIELISLGTIDRAIAEPVDVFSFALQKQASKIILVHNHPSGDVEPSASDIALTDRMLAIGHFLSVPLIDHLIISTDNFFSFIDTGLLQRIELETKFDLTFSNVKKQEDKKAMEIAFAFLQNGATLDLVVKSTGLPKEIVQGLKKTLPKKKK